MASEEAAKVALDEDVRPLLAQLLRERGWDAVSVIDVGKRGVSDVQQLEWSASERRVLITHNAADFARLASEWAQLGRAHAGLMMIRQGSISVLLRFMLEALNRFPTASDWQNRVEWLGGRTGPRRRRKKA